MSPLDLPPELRSRLRRLSLTPRRPAILSGAGLHDSRNRGGGLEFAQYRAYERGDDLRRIDWKLYARSDRLFVRDAERESPIAAWIVLDASASMAQADLATPDWTRFDAALQLAASLIEIALHQGDRFGVCVVSEARPLVVEPGGGPPHRDRIFRALAPLRPAGENTSPVKEVADRRWHGHVFVAVDARWVLHDITLDGNTFKSSHSVDKRPMVADIGYGVALHRGHWRFALARYHRTREFDGQEDIPVYGTFTIGRHF